MVNALDVLRERGFVKQLTHDEPLRNLLGREVVTAYVGLDPTADSLHIGHTVPIMAAAHLQRAGHRPVVILGGGTAMIGDPSGKTDLRQMLTEAQIEANVRGIRTQLDRFLDFTDDKALCLNNMAWLRELNYIAFLREVGVHFSVNRMLTAECYKGRLDTGLSFIEFNYMLLQSYDYLHLYRNLGCKLQMGGDDQWSNILGGADLVRRVERDEVYGITYPLVTTASGKKMGKTEEGAIWLDAMRTSPYDFYQYWRNTHDADVAKFLAFFTFLPMDEVRRLSALQGRDINLAKKILAFEATSIVHGAQLAREAEQAAEALFEGGQDLSTIPMATIAKEWLERGGSVVDLLVQTGIVPSKGEGRRLIQGGGLQVNQERVERDDLLIDMTFVREGRIEVRRGKKQFVHVKPV